MIRDGRASDADRPNSSRWRFVRGLSDHQIKLAAAILMLAGFNVTAGAYAQTSQESVASCVEKCSGDEKQCIQNGSSEELCDYDFKMCKKACSENK
jgi:hypothetical protein